MTFNSRDVAAEALSKGENPIRAVIFQALGYASMCWTEETGERVFDSRLAAALGDDVVAYLASLGYPMNKRPDVAETYRDSRGKYRFRIKAGNGEITDPSQGYSTRWGATRGARRGRPGIEVRWLGRRPGL